MSKKTEKITIERSQTLDAMLHQVLNHALVAINAPAGSLMQVHPKQDALQIKARLGEPRPGRNAERVYQIDDNSIAGWVAKHKKSYLCLDVEDDDHFMRSRSGKNFDRLLSVPIIYEDKVIAVINADAKGEHYFSEEDKIKLEQIARQVAFPIAERISLLDALSEVGVELTRLPGEGGVESVLKRIAELAVKSLGADVVTLYQYNQEKDEFLVEGTGPTIAGTIGDPHPMRRKVYPNVDVPWIMVKERRSGFYSDVHEHDFLTREVKRPGDTPRPRFIQREKIQSMAALLLPNRAAESKEEEVMGVMFANYRTKHDFNIDEISALNTFADYAAVAILNARREEQWREEQRQEEQRRSLARQLRYEEQMKIVETVSANFAHRLSNLAGTSRVATQILRENVSSSDEFSVRQLDRIEREANVLLGLAARLAYPFKEIGRGLELRPIDITQVIKDELARLEPDPNKIAVEIKGVSSLPMVQSVEFQLRQVLYDVFNNAVEAMKSQELGKLLIQVRHNEHKNQIEVEISDNGPGIPGEFREKLFAPGVTTKKEQLGIGLWWCQTFMRATGGDIILKDTQLGQGTTFVVKVPCANEGIIAFNTSSLYSGREIDILIVEDREEWQNVLIDVLITEQYSIEIANSYAKAVKSLATAYYKLIVVDLKLDATDPENREGLRILKDLDQSDLKTKVIIVTGHGTEELKEIAETSQRLIKFIDKSRFDVAEFRELARQAITQIKVS